MEFTKELNGLFILTIYNLVWSVGGLNKQILNKPTNVYTE